MVACSTKKPDIEKIKKELLTTDKTFSDLSQANGMNFAFTNYIDPNCIMLRPNGMPLIGKDSILMAISKNNDESQSDTLTWVPMFADVATSGDMGYTYGTYKHQSKGVAEEGTYVTIWKKDKNDKWKFVFDAANEGLKQPAPPVKKVVKKKAVEKKKKTTKKTTKTTTTTKKK